MLCRLALIGALSAAAVSRASAAPPTTRPATLTSADQLAEENKRLRAEVRRLQREIELLRERLHRQPQPAPDVKIRPDLRFDLPDDRLKLPDLRPRRQDPDARAPVPPPTPRFPHADPPRVPPDAEWRGQGDTGHYIIPLGR